MDENIFAKLLFSSMLEIYFDIKFWVSNCVCVCIFFLVSSAILVSFHLVRLVLPMFSLKDEV